jgi:hypothetical protein
MMDVIVERFEAPDDIREIIEGRVELVPAGTATAALPMAGSWCHFLGADHYAG